MEVQRLVNERNAGWQQGDLIEVGLINWLQQGWVSKQKVAGSHSHGVGCRAVKMHRLLGSAQWSRPR